MSQSPAMSAVVDAPPIPPAPFEPPATSTDRPAGLRIRLGAYIIDELIIAAAWATVIGMDYAGLNGAFASLGLLAMSVFYAPIMLAYHDGATWGKQALRQRVVVHADHGPIGLGRALARELVRWVSGWLVLPLLISAVMVGVRKDKRALHDLMAGTAVVVRS